MTNQPVPIIDRQNLGIFRGIQNDGIPSGILECFLAHVSRFIILNGFANTLHLLVRMYVG